MTDAGDVEGLLRAAAPRALGALVRRRGDFAGAEDAVQEALLAAATEWPARGVPDDPTAWLVRLADRRLVDAPIGPYQLQAAIAAVHAEAAAAEDTDWREILGLYDMLVALAPSPMTRLNRVVALAMVDGPAAGPLALDTVTDPTLAGHHRSHAVRAHLLEEIGDLDGARHEYEIAAELTHSLPERQHLLRRAARLGDVSG